MYIHEREMETLNEVSDAQWREKCVSRQQRVFELQRQFEEVNVTELTDNKLGCALFGLHWTELDLSKIHEIENKIIRTYELTYREPCVCVHFTVLCLPLLSYDDTADEVSLLRISKNAEKHFFVDQHARVYRSWNDFLQHNLLPDCVICTPIQGNYKALSGHVQLQYEKSYSNIRYCTEFITNLMVLLAIVSASLLYLWELMNLNTTLAYYTAIVGLVCGICMIFNTLVTILDRIQHFQSLWDPMDMLNVIFAGVLMTSNVMMYEEYRKQNDPSILSRILDYTPEYMTTLTQNMVHKSSQLFPALKKFADFCGFGQHYRLIVNFLTWE